MSMHGRAWLAPSLTLTPGFLVERLYVYTLDLVDLGRRLQDRNLEAAAARFRASPW